MKSLDSPNNHHLSAAIGWLELGNWQEANEELEKIAPALRAHPPSYNIYVMLKSRDASFGARCKACCATIVFCVLLGVQSGRTEGTRCLLEYAPGPADNSLKGLVPYPSAGADGFPPQHGVLLFPALGPRHWV